MSVVNRQNSLFASEDWKVVYKAYSEISFQAYDYDTIRAALVDYIKTNYPENFNDYIESSEFIAIIEMLAYLSQSLAFRMDLNTRENFLETAERRDSVFKLARMLGYNPKRNYPATGLVKLTSVQTTETITDSQDTALNNREVFWDDANNPQSYEQFILILNAAMSRVNRFTSPIKTGTVQGIQTELYQLNTPLTAPVAYLFNATVAGVERPFNIVNPDFVDNGSIFERAPDPANLFNLIYRNDSKGLASRDTGFFLMFRQGTLNFEDFNFTDPIPGRTQDFDVRNINETDVFLQEITTGGLVRTQWTKVPNVVGQTLNFNDVALDTRNLYAVQNRNNQGIKLVFSDGNFGNIPSGVYRLWYRVSEPTRYTIQPEDMRDISIRIPYQDVRGNQQTLILRFSLQQSINNSLPPESLAAIKERAPQVYYTQNRMVNNADYNTLPLSVNSSIRKIKAINRTHAGHSRYIDLNDPTGVYNDVDTFALDAFLYVEDNPQTRRLLVNDNNTPINLATSDIPLILKDQRLNNFVYYGQRQALLDYNINYFNLTETVTGRPTRYTWRPLPVSSQGNTGYITEEWSVPGVKSVMTNSTAETRRFAINNYIKWTAPGNPGEYLWARITGVTNNGVLSSGLATSVGPWTMSVDIPDGWQAVECVTTLRKIFTDQEAVTIQSYIENRRTFGIAYDSGQDNFVILENADVDAPWTPFELGPESNWLIHMKYEPIDKLSYAYVVTHRGQDYVAQSERELRFFNVKSVKSVNSDNKADQDQVIFTTLNTKPGFTEVQKWTLNGSISSNGVWENQLTGYQANPQGYQTNIPMPSRDIKWYDVQAEWVSNFGILDCSNSRVPDFDSQIATGVDKIGANLFGVNGNQYVGEATVGINTFYDDGSRRSATTNITIANNAGMITAIPNTIDIPVNASTFGPTANVFDYQGNITYRQFDEAGQFLELYHGGVDGVFSYGPDGKTPQPGRPGRLQVSSVSGYEPGSNATLTGTLTYSRLSENIYHSSRDRTNLLSEDKLSLTYNRNSELLDDNIVWNIYDTYVYPDGYVDPSKVILSPVDTDGDLVPDRPLQFSEFVGDRDILLFEYFTDFDGYTYDRPVSDVIWDLRYQGGSIREQYPDAREFAPNTQYSVGQVILDTQYQQYYSATQNFDSMTYAITELLDVNALRPLPQPAKPNTGVRWDSTTNTLSPNSYNDPRPADDIGWVLVRDFGDVIQNDGRGLENNQGGLAGLKVYTELAATINGTHYPAGGVYIMTPNSTNPNIVRAVATTDFFWRRGRGKTQDTSASDIRPGIMRWNHVAPGDTRIDPSISNVIENVVLTETYYDRIRAWLANPLTEFPSPPTSAQLSTNFAGLNQYKCASDTLTFRSAQFVRLFGESADTRYQARFKVVKLTNQLSDNELKSRIIQAINTYFDVDNWEFGETFYFTEMASYIHQQLGSNMGSIVIVPRSTSGVFGQGFQVKAQPNELFLSTATVDDIEIISQIDAQSLSPLR